ncbi:MAG: ABC transporter substrate-binding protein [Firmicutes bacterium]|nr:ABC transporter substrate-binding protein [Bacillota bacterium]
MPGKKFLLKSALLITTAAVLCLAVIILYIRWRPVPQPFLSPAGEGGNGITLTDQFGREVLIPEPPRRIVSTAPSNTEILFALGLGERVVAVSDWCDYPPAALALPKIGDIFPVNIEKVLSFRPDLVLAHEFSGRESVLKLEELGVPVLALKPDSFTNILDSIILIGRATGREAVAGELVGRLRRILEEVEEAGRRGIKAGEGRLKVYAGEIGGELLWAAGPGSFLDQAITLAGGENIAGDLAKPWGQMNMEIILEKNPDVILLTIPGADPESIYADKLWEETAAVKKRQVFAVDNRYSIPGPRMIEALADLQALLAGCN